MGIKSTIKAVSDPSVTGQSPYKIAEDSRFASVSTPALRKTLTDANNTGTSSNKPFKDFTTLLGKHTNTLLKSAWDKLTFGASGNRGADVSKDAETMTPEDIFGSLMESVGSSDHMATYRTNNQQYLDQSKKLSDQIYNYTDFLKNLGVDAMAEAKANPLETDWGKALLNYYGVASLDAANGALADGAADNGGNIDSYAAANAERQRLSKLNAGITALSGMSSDRVNNMLSVLNGIGVNTANLFGIEDSNLTTAAGNVATAADLGATLYGTDAQSKADYANYLATLHSIDAQSTTDYYNAMLGLFGGGSTGDTTTETGATDNYLDKETAKDLLKLLWDSSNDKEKVLDDMVAMYPGYANYLLGLEYWLDEIIAAENGSQLGETVATGTE